MTETSKHALIDYTNWEGERRHRLIRPIEIIFGSNNWHQVPQWLLSAVDVETNQLRTFAMESIHSWECAPTSEALTDQAAGETE